MTILLFLLFVSFTSATLQEDFKNELSNVRAAFSNGLEKAIPLHTALGVEDSKDVQRLERDIKEELKKHIEEAFEKAIKKIEDAIKNNKQINEKALEMLKDLKEKMKNLQIEDHEVTEQLEELKAKVDKHLKQIMEKMGIFDKRSTEPDMPEILQGILGDVSFKELLLKLKKVILEQFNVKTFKDALGKIIGQATERLCNWITNKGKEKVLDVLEGIFDSDAEHQKRASPNRYLEIEDYLKNIEENVDDKLAKFKKWLRDLLEKGINEAKEKIKKVTEIIKETIAQSKSISKKELFDILEHIRDYEDKFGSLYDLRNVIQEFLRKKN